VVLRDVLILYNATVYKKQPTILAERVGKEFLPFVRRPSRYIGGEINQVKKDLSRCELTIALCFPDVYEVGMSNTGLAILYDILNNLDGIAAERVYAPWIDAEKILREKAIPLFSLESKLALKSFDVVGFSLTNELCYTNVLNVLDLAGINIHSSERSGSDPLIIAGGAMANCCEPVADFIDLFVLGEGEEAIVELIELIRQEKKNGSQKEHILLKAARTFEWVYVPCLYQFEYANSRIEKFVPKCPDLPTQFKNAVTKDFENTAVACTPIVPFAQIVHERVSIEIMRGCPGRCLFCQASFCKRPVRVRSVERIVELAKTCYKATGFDTIGLLSLSTADYPRLEELVASLQEYFKDRQVGISLPSLRVDQQLQLVPKLATSVRKSGLTIAVESASEKVRQIINKPLKDKDLFAAVEAAYKAGWQKLKLYFMVGLPGETEEDIAQIVRLSSDLARLRKRTDRRTGQINITVSWFVPKPHTPLGWLGQKPRGYFENAKQLILAEKRKLSAKYLKFKFHHIDRSILESAIGKGGRRLCSVIETAWQNGARFDLWDECFDYSIWQKAFEKFGFDLEVTAQTQLDTDQTPPWGHLAGPDKEYLLKLFAQAMEKIEG